MAGRYGDLAWRPSVVEDLGRCSLHQDIALTVCRYVPLIWQLPAT